ncbi:MAG: hypothetical protein CM1200mP2_21200 [Planctomycetaceae bacterium]|nr:MAG: hypothetical protein CM1200mP2_21200 [Planctomycetaceae bacterium]
MGIQGDASGFQIELKVSRMSGASVEISGAGERSGCVSSRQFVEVPRIVFRGDRGRELSTDLLDQPWESLIADRYVDESAVECGGQFLVETGRTNQPAAYVGCSCQFHGFQRPADVG